MQTQTFSLKQLELMRLWRAGGLRRLNILTGSVRSGKTWVSLVLWALWVWSMPEDRAYLMVAKTLTSLRRNCLDLLQALVGNSNFTYSIPAKEAWLFGRRVYLEGANDARAESKIRGMTLQGAYVDEITLMEENFFTMLLSRLSEAGAKLIGTTNPDNPNHWLMQNFLNRAADLDMLVMPFLIEDNSFLDQDYVESLRREYTGVFYERYILGRWVIAEGLVYPMFAAEHHVVPAIERAYERYYIANDYGTKHPCVFQLFGLHQGVWYMVKEYYHHGEKDGQKTVEEHLADLRAFAGPLLITRLITDNAPVAASFNIAARRDRFRAQEADNEVLAGIQDVATALTSGRLKINDCCKHTIREFGLYSWNDKSVTDEPVKQNDDTMDCLRYFVKTIMRRGRIGGY